MRLSIKRANKTIEGTGFWLPKQSTTSGKIRIENEDGVYLFTSNTVFNAVRRCLERDKADYEAFERWQAAGSPGNSYAPFFKPVHYSDEQVKEIIRGKSEKAKKYAPR